MTIKELIEELQAAVAGGIPEDSEIERIVGHPRGTKVGIFPVAGQRVVMILVHSQEHLDRMKKAAERRNK